MEQEKSKKMQTVLSNQNGLADWCEAFQQENELSNSSFLRLAVIAFRKLKFKNGEKNANASDY